MIKVKKRKILLLPGDGIGPEVIGEVKKIIQWFNSNKSLDFEIDEDLAGQKIIFGNNEINFELDQFKKKCLLEWLDDIALSLEKIDKILIYEKKIKLNKPWIFND